MIKGLVKLAVLGGVAYAVVQSLPDIKRYMRMRQM